MASISKAEVPNLFLVMDRFYIALVNWIIALVIKYNADVICT